MVSNVGAQYCVYEDSGSLVESINRIYPLMDCILILLNYDPWCGAGNIQSSFETYKKVKDIPDPDNKIMLISQHWKTEAIQRNFGKEVLHQKGIKWTFIVDDDELFNENELKYAIEYLKTTTAGVVLVHQQIYWKSMDYCIANLSNSSPTFVLSDNSIAWFHYCRNAKVVGTWETISPEFIVSHHLSYVRTDQQLLRKIETFSHGNESRTDGLETKKIWEDWLNNIWYKWTPDMENLHPNPDGRKSFSKAIKTIDSKYQLNKPVKENIDITENKPEVNLLSYEETQFVKYKSYESQISRWYEGQRRFIKEWMLDIPKDFRILDIACGEGVGLKYFREFEYSSLYGVEFEKEKAELASKYGYPIYSIDMHDLKEFNDSFFDVVYSSHTLEHSYDPHKAVTEIRRILKPSGQFIVVLPFPDNGPGDAHCGKFKLGTDLNDGGVIVKEFFHRHGFTIADSKMDNYREPEIWLKLVKV